MGCNTAQNEVGGKSLILKACTAVASIATDATTATITKTAHGLSVGDVVSPTGGLGSIVLLTVGAFYYVKTVPTVDTFTISATKSGSAIIPGFVQAAIAMDFYTNVGGVRSKSLSFSADGIDITNHDSDEWKKLLDGAGIRSGAFSGSGVYTNQTLLQALYTRFLANSLTCLMLIEVGTARLYEGCFKITSMEISGDYDGEGAFSISADSAGQIQTALLS